MRTGSDCRNIDELLESLTHVCFVGATHSRSYNEREISRPMTAVQLLHGAADVE